jgi:hypothetical protein
MFIISKYYKGILPQVVTQGSTRCHNLGQGIPRMSLCSWSGVSEKLRITAFEEPQLHSTYHLLYLL